MVYAEGLQDGDSAKIVRLVDGVPVTTDGPFAESKESLIGFWVLDVDRRGADPRDRRQDRRSTAGSDARSARSDGCRAVTVDDGHDRGPAARAGAAGPRHPRPQARPVRRVRGRGPGGAARRAPAVAGATGVPDSPRSWLVTVASRRLVDEWRSEQRPAPAGGAPSPRSSRAGPTEQRDDTLTLLFLCCHPALSVPSQLALTLRAVGGLTTAEIAARVPGAGGDDGATDQPGQEDAPGRRSFELPPPAERAGAAAGGPARALPDLQRGVRRVRRAAAAAGRPHRGGGPAGPAGARPVPDDGEVAGLLALMLLTEARRAARTDADGLLVPLAEQDRSGGTRG